MRVLIGHSYFLHFDPKLEAAMQPYPPLGTLLAAAQVREAGHEVVVFDAMLESSEAGWTRMLAEEQPDVAVLFEDNFNYLSKMCLLNMRDAAMGMLGAAAERGVSAVACGSDASDHPELYLEAGAVAVITGEGDQTLLELLERMSDERPGSLEDVRGLTIRSAEGSLAAGGGRSNMKDLDGLPLPAWDLIDIERYRAVWLENHGLVSWNVATTRGCPYHCNWCAKPIWGQRYNARSPGSVVAELVALDELVGPDYIWFADDIFGLKADWIARFADEASRADLALRFKCLSRPDLLTRGSTVTDLARAGCDIVWIGAESGSQRILDAMEKGTTVDQIETAASLVHEAGFKIGFFIQFGYPGEERADIDATLDLIRRARPDDIGMSVAYPLPGTKFHERVVAEMGDVRNWSDSEDLAMLFEGPYSTAFYRQLHRTLHREYRPRQYWWELSRSRSALSARRTLGALRDMAWLAVDRWKLRRLEGDGPQLGSLPVELDHGQASVPSPQLVDPSDC